MLDDDYTVTDRSENSSILTESSECSEESTTSDTTNDSSLENSKEVE